jgi:hypothetical protein
MTKQNETDESSNESPLVLSTSTIKPLTTPSEDATDVKTTKHTNQPVTNSACGKPETGCKPP